MTRLTRLPDRALWRLAAGALCLTIAAAVLGAHELVSHPVTIDRIEHQEP